MPCDAVLLLLKYRAGRPGTENYMLPFSALGGMDCPYPYLRTQRSLQAPAADHPDEATALGIETGPRPISDCCNQFVCHAYILKFRQLYRER